MMHHILEELHMTGEEVLEWYRMTPGERFLESQKLWDVFILLGGSVDPERDTQSPFNFTEA
jgi:hypothetical protein